MKLKELTETIVRKKTIRKGKFKIRTTSDRPGYKVKKQKTGGYVEIRMSPEEIRKRHRSAKVASRKRKGKMSQINQKRYISIARRTKGM